ncbi:MAG TPA: S4 domain-containing protein, partial [Planctomycetaceae bacterium]|nr:S4 domain-containing protein [Planctomycetaceae bacterium]
MNRLPQACFCLRAQNCTNLIRNRSTKRHAIRVTGLPSKGTPNPSTPAMGVQLIRTFAAVDDGTRLDRALTRLFPEHSRSFLAKLIDDGRVLIDGRPATKTSARVTAGASVQVDLPPPTPTEIVSQDLPLKIIFEDEDLVVIDKPAGLVVHPAAGHADRTLVNALLFH